MASYNLNEVLKEREERKRKEKEAAMWGTADNASSKEAASGSAGSGVIADEEVDLGDVSRVKVLSPGRQVFKRFIRNRLAVVGSSILIVMFVFSFLGPLVYPYGQKEIFYKFDKQNVNYSLARENTAYNGYDVDPDISVSRSVVNAMNSNIKQMIAGHETTRTIVADEGSFLIREQVPNIYTLSALELESICTVGEGTFKVGTYSQVGKKFDFDTDEIAGVAEAAASQIKGAEGTFTVDGTEYTFTKGSKPKTFDVFASSEGVTYRRGAQELLAESLADNGRSAADTPSGIPSDQEGLDAAVADEAEDEELTEAGELAEIEELTEAGELAEAAEPAVEDLTEAEESTEPVISEEMADTAKLSGSGEEAADAAELPETGEEAADAAELPETGEEAADIASLQEFEEAAMAAVSSGQEQFTWNGRVFQIVSGSSLSEIYLAGEEHLAKVYSRYTLDTYETGAVIPGDFRAAALTAAGSADTFEAGGKTWKLEMEDNALFVYDESGEEFGEFNGFSVRRYSGEDTMSYDLKKAISEKIEEMLVTGEKTGVLTAQIPQQEEDGSYSVGEDGSYILNDAQLKITQRLEGEYVINCDQILYVINRFGEPDAEHVLGTDGDGFDVLSRVMYGGRISLMVGFVVVFIEILIGVIMGGIAGYFGGWVDNLIMRLVDVFYCLPSLPIMIILGAMMDAQRLDSYLRLMVLMAALGLMGWASVARMVRGQILSLREQEFMVATEATGIRVKDRIFKHLVPNVMPQLIVIATMSLGGVIITESTLSFLGLGVKHPLATWGTIINSVSSASAMAHYAFIWIPVGLLICLTVIAFNFVGDGLRDAYDPKAKR